MNYRIQVSLSKRQLTLYQDNQPLRIYPVGVGKSATPTLPGSYKIANKLMHPGGPYGVLWMSLGSKGYGIHGTNNPASIGKFVSHGCIRMYNRDVLDLAKYVTIGTPVDIAA